MMQDGEYYIGDLCYVMHDKWDEVCSLIIQGEDVLDGEFTLSDGTIFAIYSTYYGDGEYRDFQGRTYEVDAGCIGCILVSQISPGELENVNLGNIIEFTSDFSTHSEKGLICFGGMIIDTKEDPADGFGQNWNDWDWVDGNGE